MYLQNNDTLMRQKIWELPQNSSAGQIVEKMNLPKEIRVTVLINHHSVDQKAILKEGDIIHILPQMFGG
jgi:molybdopterin converting factor small subunit